MVATKGCPITVHHGQRDPRIATGGFDHCLPWLQRAAVPRILNDRVSQSVFYRRHGVEGLNFHIYIHMLGRYPIELDDGRVADGLQYVVVFHSGLHKALGCEGSAGFAGVIMADMQVSNMGTITKTTPRVVKTISSSSPSRCSTASSINIKPRTPVETVSRLGCR